MRIVIADDEPHLASHLCARLAAVWPEADIVAVAANGVEALDRIEDLRPDAAFLDIRMPGINGIEVAERVTAPCRIVFVTAYDQYAVEAFEREAVDYLLKPINDERLAKTVERLRHGAPPSAAAVTRLLQLMEKPVPAPPPLQWIRAQCGNTVRLIAVDEICYFQATDKYTAVVTRDAELLIRTPIKELAAQLDANQFWQVHRSTVVNARQVVSAQQDPLGRVRLLLRDRPETVAVSRQYAHLFRQM